MIKIIPDHEGWLTQRDKNRTVLVSGLDLTEYPDAVIQFSSPNDGVDRAYPVKPYVGDDGLVHAKFPNIFLTFPGRVDVCVYRDDHTCSFGVLIVAPHDDLMISKYCREHDVMMVTVLPCIVQHPDDDSLLGHRHDWKRTSKYYDEKGQADWKNRSILPVL